MVVNVPTENAERVGLRRVISEDMVTKVVKVLSGSGTQMPKNWNRRFKHNRDKMKTGDIFELAEVVMNLSLRDHEKGHDDLGELEDVAGLHLVAVVLEAPVPVLRHLRAAAGEGLQNLVDHLLVDHFSQADGVGVLGR